MNYYTSSGTCAGLNCSNPTFMPGPTPPCANRAPLSVEDFDLLLSAVAQRLRLAASCNSAMLAAIALECSEALEQLQQMRLNTRHPLSVMVLRERVTGTIVTCWANPQGLSRFAKTTKTRRAA